MATIIKENNELKEKSQELDRYKRRWNLRIRGLKEKMNEDIRKEVIQLLSKIDPHGTNRSAGVAICFNKCPGKIVTYKTDEEGHWLTVVMNVEGYFFYFSEHKRI